MLIMNSLEKNLFYSNGTNLCCEIISQVIHKKMSINPIWSTNDRKKETISPQSSLENYRVYWSYSQSHGWGVIYRNMGNSKALISLRSSWWYYWIEASFLSFLSNLQASTLKSFLAQKLLLCTNPGEGPCESCNFMNFLSLISLISFPSLMNLIFFSLRK